MKCFDGARVLYTCIHIVSGTSLSHSILKCEIEMLPNNFYDNTFISNYHTVSLFPGSAFYKRYTVI